MHAGPVVQDPTNGLSVVPLPLDLDTFRTRRYAVVENVSYRRLKRIADPPEGADEGGSRWRYSARWHGKNLKEPHGNKENATYQGLRALASRVRGSTS